MLTEQQADSLRIVLDLAFSAKAEAEEEPEAAKEHQQAIDDMWNLLLTRGE